MKNQNNPRDLFPKLTLIILGVLLLAVVSIQVYIVSSFLQIRNQNHQGEPPSLAALASENEDPSSEPAPAPPVPSSSMSSSKIPSSSPSSQSPSSVYSPPYIPPVSSENPQPALDGGNYKLSVVSNPSTDAKRIYFLIHDIKAAHVYIDLSNCEIISDMYGFTGIFSGRTEIRGWTYASIYKLTIRVFN